MNFISFLDLETASNGLFFIEYYHHWHSEVQRSETTLQISSIQTDLVELEIKGCSILTLNRKFYLCVRSIFENGVSYIIAKSLNSEEGSSNFAQKGHI